MGVSFLISSMVVIVQGLVFGSCKEKLIDVVLVHSVLALWFVGIIPFLYVWKATCDYICSAIVYSMLCILPTSDALDQQNSRPEKVVLQLVTL